MEILRTIYPYTLYALYILAFCAFILMMTLLFKVFGTIKAVKLTLAPVTSIQTRIESMTDTIESLKKDFKTKSDSLKEFTKKTGLFLAIVHIFFPKKKKKYFSR